MKIISFFCDNFSSFFFLSIFVLPKWIVCILQKHLQCMYARKVWVSLLDCTQHWQNPDPDESRFHFIFAQCHEDANLFFPALFSRVFQRAAIRNWLALIIFLTSGRSNCFDSIYTYTYIKDDNSVVKISGALKVTPFSKRNFAQRRSTFQNRCKLHSR